METFKEKMKAQLKTVLNDMYDTDILIWMARGSSSVLINWDEAELLWECSWIVKGDRYSAFKKHPTEAIKESIRNWARAEGLIDK